MLHPSDNLKISSLKVNRAPRLEAILWCMTTSIERVMSLRFELSSFQRYHSLEFSGDEILDANPSVLSTNQPPHFVTPHSNLFLSLFLFTLVSVHICLSRGKCNYTRLAINNLVISRQYNTQRRQPFHAFSNVRERQCFLNKLTGNAWPVTRLSNEM